LSKPALKTFFDGLANLDSIFLIAFLVFYAIPSMILEVFDFMVLASFEVRV